MSVLEEQFRQLVMAAVAERTAANGGVISRAELSALRLANGETPRYRHEQRDLESGVDPARRRALSPFG